MENEKLIQDYYNGKLSTADRASFETQLLTDVTLAREVKEFKNLKNAVKAHERSVLKKQLQSLEDDGVSTLETTNSSFTKRYRFIYAAAAIIIFAVIGFQFLESKPNSQDLYASFYQSQPNTLQPVTRGNEATDDLSKAFEAYEASQFEKAAILFENALKTNYDSNVAFFQSMSYLNAGKEADANNLITKLKKEETAYLPNLYWYSALIALKNNDKETVISQLDSLSQLKSSFKESDIKSLKEHLAD